MNTTPNYQSITTQPTNANLMYPSSASIATSATMCSTTISNRYTLASSTNPNHGINIEDQDTVFKTPKGVVTVNEIIEFMAIMKQRLLILTPAFEKHEQYPALLAAYSNYQMIEKLCTEAKDLK